MVKQHTVVQNDAVEELRRLHKHLKWEIENRLKEFEEIWESGSDDDIFHELVFCLLTPQSKAKSCFGAVTSLIDDDTLLSGNVKEIAKTLKGKVRFHNNKSKHIVLARQRFTHNGRIRIRHVIADINNPFEAREWFVRNIKGMGYKEVSHFLRNIGLGENLAILDRHILKNLVLLAVIEEIPASISRKRYLEIEAEMKKFAENIKIPMTHLDLLLWYMETKEIFK